LTTVDERSQRKFVPSLFGTTISIRRAGTVRTRGSVQVRDGLDAVGRYRTCEPVALWASRLWLIAA
jgi:hypothetical protein